MPPYLSQIRIWSMSHVEPSVNLCLRYSTNVITSSAISTLGVTEAIVSNNGQERPTEQRRQRAPFHRSESGHFYHWSCYTLYPINIPIVGFCVILLYYSSQCKSVIYLTISSGPFHWHRSDRVIVRVPTMERSWSTSRKVSIKRQQKRQMWERAYYLYVLCSIVVILVMLKDTDAEI